jgi:hypothetical protein
MNRASSLLKQAVYSQLASDPRNTRTASKTLTEEIMGMVSTMLRQAAMRPNIVGNTCGITADNAGLVGSRVLAMLRRSSPSAARFFDTDVAAKTLLVATTSWASLIASTQDVADAQGALNFAALAAATSMQAQYYPAVIYNIAHAIQDEYDHIKIVPQVHDRLMTLCGLLENKEGGLVGYNSRNGPLGRFHGIVELMNGSIISNAKESYFRRDNRKFNKGAAPSIESVIATSVYAMRGVIASMLDMSVELGHVVRTTHANAASPNAPKKTQYEIRKDTPFAGFLEMVCEYKRYYNATAQTKDLPAFRAALRASGMAEEEVKQVDLLHPELRWANVESTPSSYIVRSSAIIVELETRSRIYEYSNSGVLEDTAKPDARTVGIPLITYFLKHPKEALMAADIYGSTNPVTDKLRANTVQRFDNLVSSGNFPNHAAAANAIADIVKDKTQAVALTHLTRQVSNSAHSASVGTAVVEKAFK